jgi:ribonuclease R
MKLSEENVIKQIRSKSLRAMKIAEMARALKIPENQRKPFRNLIKEMGDRGSLIKVRGGRYGLPDKMNLVTGELRGHPRGFGFVAAEGSTGANDLYVHRKHMRDAMHMDLVVAQVQPGDYERPEGKIVQILERRTLKLTGTYESVGREGWVTPLEESHFHDIFIPAKNKMDANTGQIVEVEIINYPTSREAPIGKVIHVLGYTDDPNAQIKAIFRRHDAPIEFPGKVLSSADSLSPAIPDEERAHREDLRSEKIFTIDGEKAKDFDDAVSLEWDEKGYRLGVHIADVSYFVKEKSTLDKEAFQRGTSIYYPDGVLPMLPFPISNEICSLRPNEEKLVLSVSIDLDLEGNLRDYRFFPSVIKSCKRFTYTEVARTEAGDPGELTPIILEMKKLSQMLRKSRFENGSVDFNIPEAQIILSPARSVEDIIAAEHNWAHELIEEFMLMANQCAAKFLKKNKIPCVHRIHEAPDADKLTAFGEYISTFDLSLPTTVNPKSVDLHRLIQKVKNRREERVVNVLLLRSMKKALYSEKDLGHYCLGFDDYVHFTSPIRRYHDLYTHRLIKKYIDHKCPSSEKQHLHEQAIECGVQSSARERKAMAVERDVCDLRRAQYMSGKIGEIFHGNISSVTSFGFFVELNEVFVEGLVLLSSLTDDYYVYMEKEHKLQGNRSGKIFRIGDLVEVRVADVKIAQRRIGLALVKKL